MYVYSGLVVQEGVWDHNHKAEIHKYLRHHRHVLYTNMHWDNEKYKMTWTKQVRGSDKCWLKVMI